MVKPSMNQNGKVLFARKGQAATILHLNYAGFVASVITFRAILELRLCALCQAI